MSNQSNHHPVQEGCSLWTIPVPSPLLSHERKAMASLIRHETIMANENRKKELSIKRAGKTDLSAESFPALLREDVPACSIYRRPRPKRFEDMSLEEMFAVAQYFRRSKRSQDNIIRSGAYRTDKGCSIPRGMDREKEKERLAKIMAFGTEAAEDLLQPYKPTKISSRSDVEIKETDEFEELINEIEEREHFLQQMDKIGTNKELRQRVTAEVIEILVKLKNLDPVRYNSLSTAYD